MVRRERGRALCALAGALALTAGSLTYAEPVHIDMSDAPTQVIAGQPFSFLVRLIDNVANEQDQFVSYSLDIDVAPLPGATGSMTSIVPGGGVPGRGGVSSNFYMSENYIEADPFGPQKTLIGVINNGGDNGIFALGIESSLMPASPAGPGHDVLLQAVFTTTPSTLGTFSLNLEDLGTQLVMGDGFEAPFTWEPAVIEVVPLPEPGYLALLAMTMTVTFRRRRNRT